MTRYFLSLLCLLFFLIVSGCAQMPYQTSPTQSRPARPAAQPKIQPQPPGPKPAVQKHPAAMQPAANPAAAEFSRQARTLARSGQLDSAAQTLERGLRIAPKDASLWSQLAAVRLQQKRYGQARSLAAKSNSLAGGNMTIIQNNQRIIDEAQRKDQ